MNNITTIEPDAGEATTPSTALAIIPPASLPTLLAADTTDILGRLRAEIAGYVPDASTEAGRKEIGQKTRKIGVAKMDFKRLKEGLLEDAKKQVASVNAEYKVIETNCDALRDAIEGVLDAYKQIERDRVAGHEAAIKDIIDIAFYEAGSALPGEIEARISQATHRHSDRNWQDFAQRASDARATALKYLNSDLEATRKREAEAAELARLRAEAAERDRLAAIEAQRLREAQIAAEAAEAARIAAEAKAKREAEEQAAAVLRAQEEAERVAQAERDAAARREQEAAQTLAAAAERERLAQQAAAQAEARANERRVAEHRAAIESLRRLAIPMEQPDPLPVVDAKIGQLKDIFDNREWEEFAGEADVVCRASGSVLALARDQAVALAAKQDAARIQAQHDRDEAARTMAEARARQELAEQREVEWVAAEKRAANIAHQRKINGEVVEDIVSAMATHDAISPGNAEDIARSIVRALAKGEIRHVKIGY